MYERGRGKCGVWGGELEAGGAEKVEGVVMRSCSGEDGVGMYVKVVMGLKCSRIRGRYVCPVGVI